MRLRPCQLLPVFASLAILLLGGCAAFEPGAPVAAVNVRAHSSFAVRDAVERVFNEAGYRTSARSYDSITFEKAASRMDQVSYGDWIGGEVVQRARVVVAEKGEDRFRIRCIPLIVQNAGNNSFEDEHRRLQLFSPHYSHLMGEVARELR